MERRLIRKRWQITIPREIRRYLSLYVGQGLSFRLGEAGEIIIITGTPPHREDLAALQEVGARKKKKRGRYPCGKKIRKSDKIRDARMEKLMESPVRSAALELKEMVHHVSGYLQEVQKRLEKLEQGHSEWSRTR